MLLHRTEKQHEASRRNGAKSRGPVTAAGKSASSANSLRHGLRSRTAESPLRGLVPDFYQQLTTRGALYKLYPFVSRPAERIIERLSFELPLFENLRAKLAQNPESDALRKIEARLSSQTRRDLEILDGLCK